MITEDSFFYLPNLYTFQNGNAFYGSFRGLRFYVEVVENAPELHLETDAARALRAQVWLGEYCMEESEMLASVYFPLDEQGYESLLVWLDQQYQCFILAAQQDAAEAEKGV